MKHGICQSCSGSGENSDSTGKAANCSRCDGIGVQLSSSAVDFRESNYDSHDLVVLPEDAGIGTYTSRKQEPGSWGDKEGS